MKKGFKLLLCVVLFGLSLKAQTIIGNTAIKLYSPNGKYQVDVYQKQLINNTKQLYYKVAYNGKNVVNESELGILIENKLFESALGIPNDTTKIWGENLSFVKATKQTVDETWKPVYGERSVVRDHYNQAILSFLKGDNPSVNADNYDKRRYYMMDLVFRVYDEGVAFRYHFPEAANGLFLHVVGEQTQFAMPTGTKAYFEPWAQGHYSLLPLHNWNGESERPLTMKLENGLTVALAEAEMVNYARMKFKLEAGKQDVLKASLYSSVDLITPYNTPWRVIMAAERAIDLIGNNDIILNLNPANKITDVSWIKPGKAIRSGLSQEEAMACIDFAAQRGLQYVHLDAGWYGPEMSVKSDAREVRADKNIDYPALTSYAAAKGIGVFVYVNQRALYQQLDELLPLYKKWGIKGIKFGFVQIGNQHWTTWLHDAVKKCAEYEILVDIHDEYRPTGFSRTYPNLLTQEGIRGNEEMPDATHNTILPFTRFLAGAGDYTISYYNGRIKNTKAHQLALAAVYYSPLQFLYWYDTPKLYKGEPEIEFFDKVKTAWDDTKAIDGEVGEFVTVARRSGREWFLGTITNVSARKVNTSLSFLGNKQQYVAHLYTDDDKVNTKTKVAVNRLLVDKNSVLQFDLKASGGAAVHLVPATKEDLKQIKKYQAKQVL